jgi:hypothetical protein
MQQTEDAWRRIRTGKDCGIGRFPSFDFGINSAWLAASLIAATLLAWLRLKASRTWPWADAKRPPWARITALPQAH